MKQAIIQILFVHQNNIYCQDSPQNQLTKLGDIQ